MDTLEDILASFFDIHDMKPETTFKLKVLFDALDRPEFLNRVPKVRTYSPPLLFYDHFFFRTFSS